VGKSQHDTGRASRAQRLAVYRPLSINGTSQQLLLCILHPRAYAVKPFLHPKTHFSLWYTSIHRYNSGDSSHGQKNTGSCRLVKCSRFRSTLKPQTWPPDITKYIRSLSKRKKQPVRTQEMSNRLLYNREDLEACVVKQRNTLSTKNNLCFAA